MEICGRSWRAATIVIVPHCCDKRPARWEAFGCSQAGSLTIGDAGWRSRSAACPQSKPLGHLASLFALRRGFGGGLRFRRWFGGGLCTDAQGAAFGLFNIERICPSYQIAQLAKAEGSGIEVGSQVGELFPNFPKRDPAVLAFHLGDDLHDDG